MKYIYELNLLNKYIKKSRIEFLAQPEIQPYLNLVYFEPKEYVYHNGDILDGIYVFLSGEWKVYSSLENGKDIIFRLIQTPRIVGEIEFILDSPAATTLLTTQPTYAVYLSHRQCRDFLKGNPLFLKEISYNMAEALYKANNNNSINQYYSPKSRIASFILSVEEDNYFTFHYKLMPGLTGMSDRHMFRILNELIQEKIIEKQDDGYYILDYKALEDMSCAAYMM